MSLNAIAELGAVGTVQTTQPALPIPDPAQHAEATVPSAKPIATGTPNPLSSSVLAALVADQGMLLGSFCGP